MLIVIYVFTFEVNVGLNNYRPEENTCSLVVAYSLLVQYYVFIKQYHRTAE